MFATTNRHFIEYKDFIEAMKPVRHVGSELNMDLKKNKNLNDLYHLSIENCFGFFLAKGPITERQEADDGWGTDSRRNREGNLAVSV